MLGLIALLPHLLLGQLKSGEAVITGAERPGAYLALLEGKKVGLIANHTSRVGEQHLADFLLSSGVDLRRIFAPEHGFRGAASAGEAIVDGKDPRTGLPVISLYGKNKKPQPEQLQELDVLIFDIQDVGARFYTYVSTMSYAMEAAAEQGLAFMLLDRPNPNGYYVDGPILEMQHRSFVGLHPVPVVHGMTLGEYAQMLNGEGWLADGQRCDLTVVTCQNWDHETAYDLPIAPSPNLPNALAVALYPSLCFFEGTPVSVGRGTDFPFQVIGAPWFGDSNTAFVPRSRPGAQNPPFAGQLCKGFDLRDFARHYLQGYGQLYWYWLVGAYELAPDKKAFFNNFFVKLAGTERLQKMIEAGSSAEDLAQAWSEERRAFLRIRRKYLLYPDNPRLD